MQIEEVHQKLQTIGKEALPLLPQFKEKESYACIDLSIGHEVSHTFDLSKQSELAAFVEQEMKRLQVPVLWGGYLEQRHLYSGSEIFRAGKLPRDIHLALDFWAEAGTEVSAPIPGTVHSFKLNPGNKDYGPTIILAHNLAGLHFHTLYGHLAAADLPKLEVGMPIQAGEIIGHLGNESENGHWSPHVHFQVMLKMYGKKGDFPGVCSRNELELMRKNCPDPTFLLRPVG